jgi:hypothetical protein
MRTWSKGTEKALIVIDAPPKFKGYATLKVEDNLWNYMPRIARTIRVPPSMMLGSWMGSDFTNDDLVRESSLLDDFEGRLIGRSKDPPGWLVELQAREGAVGVWQRIEYTVSPDGRTPLQAAYYDRKNRLARVMTFDEVRDFGERRVPAHMVLIPTDRDQAPLPDRRTELRYLEIEFDAEVGDEIFSLSNLERTR